MKLAIRGNNIFSLTFVRTVMETTYESGKRNPKWNLKIIRTE